jgi:phosphatidate phosphatase APP1
MKPILALIAASLALSACRTDQQQQPSQIGITGQLLDHGRPVAGTPVRITSANRPSHTIVTTTDGSGRFYLRNDDTGPASPGGDILRIEVVGQDYHAAGEVSPASLEVTCDLAASASRLAGDKRFWDGNDTQASLSPAGKGLKCW